MAVQRKLPAKICKCNIEKCQDSSKTSRSRPFLLNSKKSHFNLHKNITTISDEITAHSQKVSCLDIGETGRVLVTGGHDRLVNLFAIGNDKSIQVSFERSSAMDGFERKKEKKWFNERGKYAVAPLIYTKSHIGRAFLIGFDDVIVIIYFLLTVVVT